MKTQKTKTVLATKNASTAEQYQVPEEYAALGFTSTQNPVEPTELEYEDRYSGRCFTLVPPPIWNSDQTAVENALYSAYCSGVQEGREAILFEFKQAHKLILSLGLALA